LTFQDERDEGRRRKPEPAGGDGEAAARPRKRRLPASDVGEALKSAYQRTIDETIPPEMLDLLGKLG
jgi:hypothetical protein